MGDSINEFGKSIKDTLGELEKVMDDAHKEHKSTMINFSVP